MKLEHPGLPPFEPVIRRIHRLVFEGGIEALQRAGLASTREDILAAIGQSRGARQRFLRGCHYGWDLAQRRIAENVIECESESRGLRSELKAKHRSRDEEAAAGIKLLISCLESRQLVLRRLADTILYHLFEMKNYAMRHISLEHRIHRIDPTVLARTLKVASGLNHEERLSFHLISDLTTVVQVGDLVRVNLATEPRGWTLIELKEGRMNSLLSGVVEKARGELEEKHMDVIREEYGAKAAAQAKRMMRQQARQKEFEHLLETDEGIDLVTNMPTKLTAESVAVRDYENILADLCAKVRGKGFAISTVDGCYTLVGLNRDTARKLGLGGIAHLLYHLQFDVKECSLSRDNTEEIEKAKGIFPFFDLAQMNLRAMWPPPIFLWSIDSDVVFDLLFGRMFVFGHLDFDKLFQLAKIRGVSMRWAEDREVGEARISPPIPGSPDSRGIRVKLDNDRENREFTILNGFVARIFLELMCPSQFLEMVKASFSAWS